MCILKSLVLLLITKSCVGQSMYGTQSEHVMSNISEAIVPGYIPRKTRSGFIWPASWEPENDK